MADELRTLLQQARDMLAIAVELLDALDHLPRTSPANPDHGGLVTPPELLSSPMASAAGKIAPPTDSAPDCDRPRPAHECPLLPPRKRPRHEGPSDAQPVIDITDTQEVETPFPDPVLFDIHGVLRTPALNLESFPRTPCTATSPSPSEAPSSAEPPVSDGELADTAHSTAPSTASDNWSPAQVQRLRELKSNERSRPSYKAIGKILKKSPGSVKQKWNEMKNQPI